MKINVRAILLMMVAAVMYNTAYPQTCQGIASTGVNLVQNGDFSNLYNNWSHDPAYTNYTPCTGCYSVPGNIYAGSIPKNFNDAFANIQDHTTNTGDNNFLMVDGICNVGIDLWKQNNIPIKPNTNYYFSLWITSLSPADTTESGTLNFNINGVDLPTKITAPGVVGQWVRFPGVVWNSGLNPPSTISISIQNTTVTACDHAVDFAIDDIVFMEGCDYIQGPKPNLPADITLCGRTVPFSINPGFNAATAASGRMTYTWYKNGVMQTRGMGPAFYSFDVTGPGTYSVCVDSAGSCPRSDELIVNDNTKPPTRVYSPDSVFCAGTLGSIRLRIEGGSGTNLRWYTGSCGGTLVASNTNGAEVTVSAPSVATTYYARWESSGCQTTCGSVTVKPVTAPTSATAGPRQDLCNATSTNLAATAASPAGAIGKWSVLSGNGTIANVNDPQSAVSNLTPGDLVLRWTVTNAPCDAKTSDVTIHVDAFTGPTITGASLTQCATATNVVYTTSVNNAPSSTYTWTKTGSLTIVSTSSNSVTVNIGNTGGTLTVTETKGACSASTSADIISVLPPDPNTTSAGPRQDLCNTTSATLAALPASPAGAIGTWTKISGTGNLPSPANDPNATVTGLIPGDLVLQWTVSNSPCASVSKQVTIHVDELTAPVITGGAAVQCATAIGVVYSTTTNNSPSSVYTWTKTGSLVITGQSTNSATVDIGNTGGTLTVTEKRGTCSASTSLDITSVLPLDATAAGPDQNLCNATATTLQATAPVAPSIGTWEVVSGTGSIAVADLENPNAPVTGLQPGDLTLKWTVKNSPCVDKSANVTIHVDTLPVPAITGSSPNQCATATSVVYKTNVNHAPATTYTWTQTGSLVITSQAANTVTLDVGSTGGTLTVTEKKGACTLSSSVTITSTPPLNATSAGIDQQVCNATSATLSATQALPPTIGFWKIISGTGVLAPADTLKHNATVTGLAPGTLVLRWTMRNSPCADSTDDVTIRMDTLVAPVLTGASFDTCKMTSGILYKTTQDNSPLSSYIWSTSGAPNTLSIVSSSANTASVNVGSSGGILTVTEQRGGCSFTASRTITIQPDLSEFLNAGIDQAVCVDYTMLNATPLNTGKGIWTLVNGTGSFEDATNPNTKVTGLSNGLNSYKWTVTGCGGPRIDTVHITLSPSNVVIDLNGPSDTLCVGAARTVTLTVSGGSSNYSYFWTSSDNSFNATTTTPYADVKPLIESTTYYVFALDNQNFGCKSMIDSVKIHAVSRQNLTMNNLMTPNEDDMNDQFIIRDASTLQKLLPGATLEVFNNWGGRIYKASDYDNKWEGSDLPAGIYYYHLKAGCGGENYKGWVQIIR